MLPWHWIRPRLVYVRCVPITSSLEACFANRTCWNELGYDLSTRVADNSGCLQKIILSSYLYVVYFSYLSIRSTFHICRRSCTLSNILIMNEWIVRVMFECSQLKPFITLGVQFDGWMQFVDRDIFASVTELPTTETYILAGNRLLLTCLYNASYK